MKLYARVLGVLLLFGCGTLPYNSENNSKAYVEVEKNLLFVRSFLDGKPDSNLTIIKVIDYLENITGIESESDGSDIGKFNPTERDYVKWEKWFDANKGRLYWDSKENKAKIK